MAKRKSKKNKDNKAPSQKSLERVAGSLFETEEEKQKFISAILDSSTKPTALIWLKEKCGIDAQQVEVPAAFPEWVSIIAANSNVGKSEQHQQGDVYCLDPSSVYAMLPLIKLVEEKKLGNQSTVVDLCSSPGGKAVFAWRAINPQQIICNEVSGPRIPALLSNLKRCKIPASIVTQADPAHFSKFNSAVADLVLVDAPCSGQSLLAKAERGLGCFSKPVINANVGRQRRILAEASKIVRPGGYILYSTCTFSPEENEKNIEWFLKHFPDFELQDKGRMWPQDGLGAGSFFALLHSMSVSYEVNEFESSAIKHWVVDLKRDS